jgi:glucose/arabinose dehydrogenase
MKNPNNAPHNPRNVRARARLWCALPAVCFFCVLASARAQSPSANVSTFTTGLNFPRGLKFGPDGNLYVAEAGAGGTMSTVGICDQAAGVGPYTGGFTSRISRITPDGRRATVADNLPSSVDAMGDYGGIEDVAFLGDTLYALSGFAGCSHGLATTPNAVLRVNVDGTTTQIADLSAFLKANPVAHPNPDDFEPDGTWYSMVATGDSLVAVEPNHGELDMITTAGVVTRIADISATQGHIVPTAVVYDGNFYVGNLQTFPPTGPAKILKITPAGAVSTFATGFTEILGLAFDAAHRLYVLESSTGGEFPNPGTGKVVRVDGANITEIATGLSLPTAMTFGPDGNLYVSNWGFGPPDMGEIVKISVVPTITSLGNISTRGFVQTGDNVMIAGFILHAGSISTDVVIRGLGPSLGDSGVNGALADPTLDLRDGSGTRLAFNNDWQDDANAAAKITAAGLAPKNSRESAILATLPAGSYTAILAGNNGGTGAGLIEVYNLK